MAGGPRPQRNAGATPMKTLKHLALAALVNAGLLLPVTSIHPQPASACSVFDPISAFTCAVLGLSTPFTAEASPCTLNIIAVSATADGNRTNYAYDVNCSTGAVHVHSTYDFATGNSGENLRNDAFTLTAVWTCTH